MVDLEPIFDEKNPRSHIAILVSPNNSLGVVLFSHHSNVASTDAKLCALYSSYPMSLKFHMHRIYDGDTTAKYFRHVAVILL